MNWCIRVSIAGLLTLLVSFPCEGQEKTQSKPLSATVSMKNGTTYEVRNASFTEGTWSGSFYHLYHGYEVKYFPLYVGEAVAIELQFNRIKNVSVGIEKDDDFDPPRAASARVTMTDSRQLEGLLWDVHGHHDHRVYNVRGRWSVQGYPASLDLPLRDVQTISFSTGTTPSALAAEIKKTDGTVVQIRQLELGIERSDSRSDSQAASTLKLSIGASTLEVPIADITSLTRNEGEDVVALRNGKTLRGTIDAGNYVCIEGGTTVSGMSGRFVTRLYRVKSIILK